MAGDNPKASDQKAPQSGGQNPLLMPAGDVSQFFKDLSNTIPEPKDLKPVFDDQGLKAFLYSDDDGAVHRFIQRAPELCESILDRSINPNKTDIILAHRLGLCLFYQKQYPEAENMFQLAIIGDVPADRKARILEKLAVCALEQNEITKSVSYIQQAESLNNIEDETTSLLLTTLGHCYLRDQKYILAKERLERAKSFDSESPLPYYYLSLTYMEEGKIAEAGVEAEQACRKSIDITDAAIRNMVIAQFNKLKNEYGYEPCPEKTPPAEPPAQDPRSVIESILSGIDNQVVYQTLYMEPKNSHEILKKLLKNDPENVVLLHRIGLCLLYQGKSDSAERYLEEALMRSSPNSNRRAMILINLAECMLVHADENSVGRAYAYLNEEDEVSNENDGLLPWVLTTYARCYMGSRDYARAREELVGAIETDLEFAPAYYYLSLLCIKESFICKQKGDLTAVAEKIAEAGQNAEIAWYWADRTGDYRLETMALNQLQRLKEGYGYAPPVANPPDSHQSPGPHNRF